MKYFIVPISLLVLCFSLILKWAPVDPIFVTQEQVVLRTMILEKLESADSGTVFRELLLIASRCDLLSTRRTIRKKWDLWAIIKIRAAGTEEELVSLRGEIPASGPSWEIYKIKKSQFEVEKLSNKKKEVETW